MSRTAEIDRKTNETSVRVSLNLDGSGRGAVDTGVGFLDHMLMQIATHGLVDLELKATGDTHIDYHHTVEDVGIALGQAVAKALGDKAGIVRYGEATVPMDEALALVALDFSGRAHLSYEDGLAGGKVGQVDTELFREFFEAFVRNANMTLHIRVLAGSNAHHVIEGVFKAFARALRKAAEKDSRRFGVPSSKGNL